jgi:hypothetical protein
MSYGNDRPGTARFAPMEWLLQVRDRAHGTPSFKTPHCLSTSTGPSSSVSRYPPRSLGNGDEIMGS